MKQNEDIFDIIFTVLDFSMAVLCALWAVRDLAREGSERLRSGIVWIVTSAAFLVCGLVELMRQDRLSIEIVRECDMEPEDGE